MMDFNAVEYAKTALRSKKGRLPRKSQAEQYNLVCAWRQSGQTQEAFCKANGVNPKTFSNGLRTYKEPTQLKESEQSRSSLVECFPLTSPVLEMELPSGMVLRIQNSISDKQFSLLLKALCQWS